MGIWATRLYNNHEASSFSTSCAAQSHGHKSKVIPTRTFEDLEAL